MAHPEQSETNRLFMGRNARPPLGASNLRVTRSGSGPSTLLLRGFSNPEVTRLSGGLFVPVGSENLISPEIAGFLDDLVKAAGDGGLDQNCGMGSRIGAQESAEPGA